jgi:hypothetical protein
MSNGIRFCEKAPIIDKIVGSQLNKLQAIEFLEFLIPESARSAGGRTQTDIDFSLILLTALLNCLTQRPQIQKPPARFEWVGAV